MKFKLYKMKIAAKEISFNIISWVLSPLKYYYSKEKEDARYAKRVSKITEDQAVKWIAEDIVRYILKNKFEIDILICDYASEDDFWDDCTLKYRPYYIKRNKTQNAYHKFPMNIEFQERIINKVKSFNAVNVEEEVEKFTYQRIKNYKKSIHIAQMK